MDMLTYYSDINVQSILLSWARVLSRIKPWKPKVQSKANSILSNSVKSSHNYIESISYSTHRMLSHLISDMKFLSNHY